MFTPQHFRNVNEALRVIFAILQQVNVHIVILSECYPELANRVPCNACLLQCILALEPAAPLIHAVLPCSQMFWRPLTDQISGP